MKKAATFGRVGLKPQSPSLFAARGMSPAAPAPASPPTAEPAPAAGSASEADYARIIAELAEQARSGGARDDAEINGEVRAWNRERRVTAAKELAINGAGKLIGKQAMKKILRGSKGGSGKDDAADDDAGADFSGNYDD